MSNRKIGKGTRGSSAAKGRREAQEAAGPRDMLGRPLPEMQVEVNGKWRPLSRVGALQDFFPDPDGRELWIVKCSRATVAVTALREDAEALLTVARLRGGDLFNSYKLFVFDPRTGQLTRKPAHRISLDPEVWKAEREVCRRIKTRARRRQAATAEVCHPGAPAKSVETRQAGA